VVKRADWPVVKRADWPVVKRADWPVASDLPERNSPSI
jgi:hypothetical protein